jgi:hypothetical protein
VSCTTTEWRYVAGLLEGPEVTYVYTFANDVIVLIQESAVSCRF